MSTIVLSGAKVYDGHALAPSTVVVVNDRVSELRPASSPLPELPPEGRVVNLAGHVLVPGLIDVHTHMLMTGEPDSYERELLRDGTPLRTLRAALHARMARDEGILTVRDVCTEGAGYADVALREAIRAAVCEGPRLLPSGPGISVTGGYLPKAFAPGICVPMGCSIVDGADAARREVREQVSYGVAWIKVFADWFYPNATTGETRDLPTFTPPELEAICDEAARRGVKVAAHVTSDAGARQAVLAGAASLEHLGPLSAETLDLAAARGVVLVPTLSQSEASLLLATDDKRRDRALSRIETSRAAFARALASGVAIACGTDIGAYPHALGSRREFGHLVSYGMSERAALDAATSTAARLLGLPELGRVSPACIADLCAFRGESLGAIVEAPPAFILQGGRIVRAPASEA